MPVTGYGVGSSLLGHNDGDADDLINEFDFTADIVMVDGKAESKVGRGLKPNKRLIRLDVAMLRQSDEERIQ